MDAALLLWLENGFRDKKAGVHCIPAQIGFGGQMPGP